MSKSKIFSYVVAAGAVAALSTPAVMAKVEKASPKATASKAQAASYGKIGVLDINRIIVEAKAAKDINKQMEVHRAKYQQKIDAQEKALRAQEKSLIETQKDLSPKAFEEKKKEFELHVASLQQAIVGSNTELQRAAQMSMEKIRTAVSDISGKHAKKEGLSFVLPTAVPVYFTKDHDITNPVIAELNKELPTVKVIVRDTDFPTLAKAGKKAKSSDAA